jgi:mRNA export factor
MAFFGSAGSTSNAGLKPVEKDPELSNPPTDSVSALAWSPQADFLAAGSWDNNVCIWRDMNLKWKS